MARTRFKYSRQRAVFTAVIATAASILGLYIASRLKDGSWTTTLENVAGTTLTLGLAAIVYEIWLRETVTEETIALVGLEHEVTATGLRSVQKRSDHDWKDMLSSAQQLQILLMNPSGWVEREWHQILSAARSGSAQITLMLPNPVGEAIPMIATKLGHEPAFLASQIESSMKFMQDGWRAANQETVPLKKGAKLSVKSYEGVPSFEFYWLDRYLALNIPSALDRQAADDAVFLLFDRTHTSFPSRWIDQQITRATLALEWENEVS